MRSTMRELIESKSYETRRVFSDEKSILMNTLTQLVGSLKGNLDQQLIKDSMEAYDSLKGEFRDALMGVLQSYQDGEITIEQFKKMVQAEIRNGWAEAYQHGVGSVGNPFGVYDEDLSWLKGARAEEYKYLSGFVDDLDSDEGAMDYETRMGMYADTLAGIFHHGQVEGSPDNVEIYWRMDPSKENCDDCIELAANSPYTKDTLPSCPGDGSTICLSRCGCSLEIVHTDEAPSREVSMKIAAPKGPKVPEGYQLPTYAEYEHMSRLSTEIDRLRGLRDATSGAKSREFAIQRRDVNQELIDYMEKNKLYYVPGSNYFQGASPGLGESIELKSTVAYLPEGYRSPLESEKERIDKIVFEINHLRSLMITEEPTRKKDWVKKRHELNEQMLAYMEKHKIYYIPDELLLHATPREQAEETKKFLIEETAQRIVKDLFGETR
jgi:hypothetical protein